MMNSEWTEFPKQWANPAVLSWARRQMGLRPEDVETRTRIAASLVIAWEQGKVKPSLADLEALGDLYACPVGHFFLEAPPAHDLSLELRGLAPAKIGGLSYETHLRLREFARLGQQAAFLVEALGLHWKPMIDSYTLGERVEDIARQQLEKFGVSAGVRQSWASPNEAYEYWRTGIEGRGVFVITLRLNPQEVRGASQWSPPTPPSILVNQSDVEPATGRTFTLLHEWVHLLLKKPGIVCDFRGPEDNAAVERFANQVASHILVPRGEFSAHLVSEGLLGFRERWGDELLDRMRAPFAVSRDVVAILLEETGLAPSGFYQRKRAMWDRMKPFFRGTSQKTARRIPTKAQRRLDELGLPLARLVATGYRRGALSMMDISDLLNMRVEKAERFLEWVQERSEREGA